MVVLVAVACDPTVTALLNSPEHWHLRAEEARSLASQLDDPDAKATMIRMADEYEKLAARALRRLRDQNVAK
jgi:hypothetical protein